MSRSSKPPVVEITKVIGSELPPFLPLLHRHFQKSLPYVPSGAMTSTLVANVDLLDLLVPQPILESIESIEIVYDKKRN